MLPWTVQLARPITLVDGTRLVTFKDALEALTHNFAGADPTAIDPAIGMLVKADATREAVDIDEASRRFEAVLCARHLMK